MRFIRAAAIVLVVFCALAVGLAVVVIHNQNRLINAVLRHIEQRTGYRITAAGSHLHFGVHLNVVLDRPSVLHAGRELVNCEKIRVLVSYHALIWNSGLPLRGIVVSRPKIRVPASSGALKFNGLPRLDGVAVRTMDRELREFSGLAERVTISDARINDDSGALLLDDFSFTAVPRHRHSPVWSIGFDAPRIKTPLKGLHLSGRMTVNTVARGANQVASRGQLWYRNGRLHQSTRYGFIINGIVHGTLRFVLRADGELDGGANIGLKGLQLSGARLSRTLDFGDYSLSTPYAISTQRISLAGIKARTKGAAVLTADVTVTDPYAADANLHIHLDGARVDTAALKSRLDAVRKLPARLAEIERGLVSGDAVIEGVAYKAPLNQLAWTPSAFLDNLTASMRLDKIVAKLPTAGKLPPLSNVDAQIAYAGRRLTISQGSAALGGSTIEKVGGEIRLGPNMRAMPYRLAVTGRLDLDQVYPAMRDLLPVLRKGSAGDIERLTGIAPVRLTASGTFNTEAPALPAHYRVSLGTSGFTVAAKGLPQTIALTGGDVTLTPGVIELTHVSATAGGAGKPGDVLLNGSLDFNARELNPRRIKVEIHQIQAQKWLPLLVDPGDIAARGPVGGTVTITKRSGGTSRVRADGRLTMGAGQIELGFLRSPIVTESATLTLDGRGLLLSIMGAKLEGSPLDLSLSVANLDRPLLRIDANAGRLDLEVMKFIRVPWSKSPPAQFWPVPAIGHIVANQANFERLRMSRVSCDFGRKANGDWRVNNFKADVYQGHAQMEFSGRGRDNWINIKGSTSGVRVGPLFGLANPSETPPLSGSMKSAFDIRANASTDFFNTMGGTISVDLSDGLLHKFTLLSRVLGLINLKTWLSAQVPNPSINGVPFQSLTADFKGNDGNFYSDDLLLRGPVMNISAQGNVRLSDGVVDMEVGLVPFKTVNWLVSQVPIIGQGLAANHLMAAYFKVSGPLGDPYVVPLPITSVAHFLANVFKLPINILKGVGEGVTGGGGKGGGSHSSNGVSGSGSGGNGASSNGTISNGGNTGSVSAPPAN